MSVGMVFFLSGVLYRRGIIGVSIFMRVFVNMTYIDGNSKIIRG